MNQDRLVERHGTRLRGCAGEVDRLCDIFESAGNSSPAQPARSIGNFELLERLGEGAFGVVWKARDQQLDRIVAVKIPRRVQLCGEEIERFLGEARAVAQLKHPNIVSVHEVGLEAEYC